MTQNKLQELLLMANPTFKLWQRVKTDIVAVWCNNQYTGYRINTGEIPYRTQRSKSRGKIRGYRELTWLLEKKNLLTKDQGAYIRNAGY